MDTRWGRDNSYQKDSTAFTSSNKNGGDPGAWTYGTSQVPNKNDIVDLGMHLRRDGTGSTDSLWLIGSVSTIGATGSRYTDFEFYQTDFQAASGGFTGAGSSSYGGHTPWTFSSGKVSQIGDFIIATEFDNTGMQSFVIRIWVSKSDWQNVTPTAFSFGSNFDGASNAATYGYADISPKNGGSQLQYIIGTVNTSSTSTPTTFQSLDKNGNMSTT